MGDLIDFVNIKQNLIAEFIVAPFRLKVTNTVGVSDANSLETIRPQGSILGVGHLITFTKEAVKGLSDTLPFTEFLSYYKVSNTWVNPGIGAPGSTNSMSLGWDGHFVDLRNPKLGDTSAYDGVRVNRNTRGNDLIIFRDPMWPDKEVLHFEFEYLTLDQSLELLDFMRLSLGCKITLIDQYNREWEGYIITPESDVVQSKRTGFDANFDFQGVLK